MKPLTAFAALAIASTALVGCDNSETRTTNPDGSFNITSYTVSNLAFSCGQDTKPTLKDPNSFKMLDHAYTNTPSHIYVTIEYTATNGFGGRVRNFNTCTYTL